MSADPNVAPASTPEPAPAAAAVPGLSGPRAGTPVGARPTRPFSWSVKRELWEHRYVAIAPLIVAALGLVAFLLGIGDLPHLMSIVSTLHPAQQHAVLVQPFDMAASVLTLVSSLLALSYCCVALHGERRDRSILFWKSLPVSDAITVLAKASIPMLWLPLITFGIIVALQLTMLMLSTVVLIVRDSGAGTLWAQLPLVRMPVVTLYGLLTLALWHAPLYGWLLLVCGWARRVGALWALLPPFAIVLLEKFAFGTSHVWDVLWHRLTGRVEVAFAPQAEGRVIDGRLLPVDPIPDPIHFLTTPGMWIGLAVAAAFIALAIRQRRYSEPI